MLNPKTFNQLENKMTKTHNITRLKLGAITIILFLNFSSAGAAAATMDESLDARTDMTQKEKDEARSAMAKIERAARNGELRSDNPEDQRLNESYQNNLKKLDAIKAEQAEAQKQIDLETKKLAYVKKYGDLINRDVNKLINKAIVAKHPELHSPHLLRQWIKNHKSESDAIAKPIMDNYDIFFTPHAKAAGF